MAHTDFRVECEEGIGPELLASLDALLSEAVVRTRWRGRVVVLDCGWLRLTGSFHPAEAFQNTEIDEKGVVPHIAELT